MHPVFAAAAILRPPRVLVFQLRQMELGHALALDAIESPYFAGGEVTGADVALAAWVCARPGAEALDAIRAGKPHALLMRTIGRVCRGIDWGSHHERMRAYIDANMMHPRRWSKGGSSGEGPRVAWQWAAAWRLCGGDWTRLRQAWNTPILNVTAWLTAGDAMHGDDTIVSEEEELRAEKLRATA